MCIVFFASLYFCTTFIYSVLQLFCYNFHFVNEKLQFHLDVYLTSLVVDICEVKSKHKDAAKIRRKGLRPKLIFLPNMINMILEEKPTLPLIPIGQHVDGGIALLGGCKRKGFKMMTLSILQHFQ